MPIKYIVMNMPCWYILVIIIFSLYYAIRGIVEQTLIQASAPCSKAQKVIIFYIQEFLFKVIITVSGFMALWIAKYILSSLKSINDIGTGTAVLLIFLIFWGIVGITGYLTFLIVSGKLPNLKG